MQFLFPALFLLVLILLAGFFAAAELGIMTLNLLKVESEARRGSRVAQIQLALRNKPQRFLSTILIGYNVANITFATYSAKLSLEYIEPHMNAKQALAIATLVDVVLVTLFAELIPKTYAAVQSEKLAAFAARPLFYLDLLLTPVNWLFEKLVNPILRLMTGGRAIDIHHEPRKRL